MSVNNLHIEKTRASNQKLETKILVAGVGGQGVVFLTNLLVKAAMFANIPVATSEIHGLAQRGGSVTAGITLGAHTYGFLEKGGIDFLIGLEPLETQRCVAYLNKNSCVVINDNRILPYSVNSGNSLYPDINKFLDFLNQQIKQVVYITETPEDFKTIHKNLYVLGRISSETDFPIEVTFIEKAIVELTFEEIEKQSLEAYRLGLGQKLINQTGGNQLKVD